MVKKEFTSIRVREVTRNILEVWKRKRNFNDLSEIVDSMIRLIKKHKMVEEL